MSDNSRSSEPTSCKSCQEGSLYWGWNRRDNRPTLVNEYAEFHLCPTPNTKDIFPGWCLLCSGKDLFWIRKNDKIELTESYGLPHTCESEVLHDICDAKCKHCPQPNLLWIKKGIKFILTDSTNGTRHNCTETSQYFKDWSEARRMNYAFEKKWIKSIPDGHKCKRCKGKSHTVLLSKNKKLMAKYQTTEPVAVHRQCRRCKGIGTFSPPQKRYYLKQLRSKYWPFKGGIHKWPKYDKMGE